MSSRARSQHVSEDALQQLDWCIGYLYGSGKERVRPEPGSVLVVAFGEVPLELLLPQLGKSVQAAAEQRSHLQAITGPPLADLGSGGPSL